MEFRNNLGTSNIKFISYSSNIDCNTGNSLSLIEELFGGMNCSMDSHI